MPEVSTSPALPITPAKPVGAQNEASRDSVKQGEESQSFSNVLREKQAAKASEAPASKTEKPDAAAGKAAPDKASEAKDPLEDGATAVATNAPDLAQWLAAAGLQARMADAGAADPASAELPSDATVIALPAAAPALTTLTDKAAAPTANLAASTATTDGRATDATPGSLLQNALAGAQNGKPDAQGEQLAGSQLPAAAQDAAPALRESAGPNFASALEQVGLNSSQQADMLRQSQAANTAAAAPGTHGNAHTAEIRTPVGQPGWAQEVGQKLVWTARQDSGKAELVLTPANLGRIEVSINTTGDQATASFIAASPAAREALQDAMPKLRDMLAQSGINLGQADVGAGQSGQGSDAAGRERRAGNGLQGNGGTGGTLTNEIGSGRVRTGTGLVDTFA